MCVPRRFTVWEYMEMENLEGGQPANLGVLEIWQL